MSLGLAESEFESEAEADVESDVSEVESDDEGLYDRRKSCIMMMPLMSSE